MTPSAAARWRDALASWAIPAEILDRAPEDPWHFPVELFASRADDAGKHLTPSNRRALDALPPGGSVLDVGCGAGAASLALVSKAGLIIGVDQSREMLDELVARAAGAGVEARAIEGTWPQAAAGITRADVVVCHHVLYNAPDLPAFVGALTAHAVERVVVELTAVHPQSNLNPLWKWFHGLDRPTEPTADIAVEVLGEMGLRPERQDWTARRRGGFRRREDLVAWIRRMLCLRADRDAEIARAIAPTLVEDDGLVGLPDRPVVTLWWPGRGTGL